MPAITVTPPDVRKHRVHAPYMLKLREAAGFSQRDWAERLGCSERTVRRIERGEHRYDYATQYLAESTAQAMGVRIA